MLHQQDKRIIYRYDAEELYIEPWGENALRVRSTKQSTMPQEDWALRKPVSSKVDISIGEEAHIVNGKIKATISSRGKIMMFNQSGQLLLEEYARHRLDLQDPKCSSLSIEAREFKPIPGGDYHLTMRLESVNKNEKIYGMGQYQQPYLDLKGLDLELAQRNSQASVPFALSSLGYGLLWNNPAIGRAVFGKNVMSFEAYSTKILDYWIVAGDTPAEIEEAYARATGTVPVMPEYGLGFWQCKLRYQTQEELLSVAREYKQRNLPIDVIVIDFFHWPKQGEWKFDPTYWPDPEAMIAELHAMNIEPMVSIWPTVDKKSENYATMLEQGLLIRSDRGIRTAMDFMGETVHFDATNPAARAFVWATVKRNYFDKGIKLFWLDEAEPEYSVYDFDTYRYHMGPNLQIGNIYPLEYARAFYEGQSQAHLLSSSSPSSSTATDPTAPILNLTRCAWASSQRYGTLIWSGDIASSWPSLRTQLCAGLNISLAGIPWWTTDIGGFHGGDPSTPSFQELLVRWFQWGTFCPVMRLHGDRDPKQPQHGTTGGAVCRSGAPNEVWSYGEEVYGILRRYLWIRETVLRRYVRGLMREASEKGTPVMRPCFYDFPEDERCWEEGGEEGRQGVDQYMFGPRYLCAPVLWEGMRRRSVYLPKGCRWAEVEFVEVNGNPDRNGDGHAQLTAHRHQAGSVMTEKLKTEHDGGQTIHVDCPIESMPVFVRL